VDLQAELSNYRAPNWKFKYRAWMDLQDFRKTLRSPMTPAGKVDVRAKERLARERCKAAAVLWVRINLNYDIFRDSGVGARGSYNRQERIAGAGSCGDRVWRNGKRACDDEVATQQFVAKTHVQSVRMAQLLPALERASFPVNELHWDSVLTADTVESWIGPFQHFEISGTMDLNPPAELAVNISRDRRCEPPLSLRSGSLDGRYAEFDTRQAEFMPPAFWGNAIRRWRSNSKRSA